MKTLLTSFLSLTAVLVATAAEMKQPAFQMEEKELLAVVTESTNLNDRITACQELCHKGTDAAVPVLGALLTEQTEAPLFHAARYGLQNIPGAAADAALREAEGRLTAKRKDAIQTSLRIRKQPVSDGYNGTPAVKREPTPLQRGDLAIVPELIAAALKNDGESRLAVRSLIGFPNEALDDKLFAMLSEETARARLAISVLGERRARKALPARAQLVKTSKDEVLRRDSCKALTSICQAKDFPLLLELLRNNPTDDELSSLLIRVLGKEFIPPCSKIVIRTAKYGNFGNNKVVDVTRRVQSMVDAGSISILVNNRLAGAGGFAYDPAPGLPKELHLTYSIDEQPDLTLIAGEEKNATLAELSLPDSVTEPFFAAYAESKGELRKALRRVLTQLERRGQVVDTKGVSFRSIFNKKDLTGWSQQDGYWRVKDGIITGESTPEHPCKPNHHIVYTAEELSDFELQAEFRLSAGANSGIQIHCAEQFVGDNGYQADMNGGGNYVGYLYHPRQHLIGERGADVAIAKDGNKNVIHFADNKELQKLYKPLQWNQIRVVAVGRTITVWINGIRTTSVTDEREEFLPTKGRIALQLHQGPPMTVEFTNLRIRD